MNTALWCILFKSDDIPVGSLFSYPAQPELAPRHDDRISAGYPGMACQVLEDSIGGTALFLLGACGGMEPEGCEKGYEEAHAYGRALANELLSMIENARPVSGDNLTVTTSRVELPVENPGFHLMMETGVIRTSQRPPNVLTTISRVDLGDIRIFTLPGESFPGIVADIGGGEDNRRITNLFINQVNDSLGYFIPREQFRTEPEEWGEGHHFTGHELESLGVKAGEVLRRQLAAMGTD